MTFQSSIGRSQEAATTPTAPPGDRQRALAGIVIVATCAAALLRFWDIGLRSLWLDEAYSGWFSDLSWARLWFETPRYEPHPPLYYSLLKAWRLLGGGDAGGLRGLSALAGVATVPAMALAAHALARLSASRRPMLLVAVACGFAALSPRLVVIGQDARPYALLVFAYALAIAGWLRLAVAFRAAPGAPGGWRQWIMLGAGAALVLWLHGIGILYAGALLAALLLSAVPAATRARWMRLAVTVAAVAALYAPCLAILAARAGDWSGGWLRWEPARFPGAMLELLGLHRFEEMATPTLALAAMPALLFVAIRGLARSREPALAWGLGLLLLAPPLAAALISQAGTPIFLPRTLVGVLAPAYLLAALAIANLPGRAGPLCGGLVALLFLINLAQAMVRPDLESWREIATLLKREMQPGDVIWVYPNDVKIPLERALGDGARIAPIPAPYPALGVPGAHPSGSPAVVAIDGAAARAWAAAHAPAPAATVWLLRGGPFFFDPEGDVLTELARGRRHGRPRSWLDLELRPLHPAR